MDEEEAEEVYERTITIDNKNVHKALDELIDSLTKFKAADRIDDLTTEDYAKFLTDLDYARFMVGGVMYLHSIPLCGHFHDDDDEEEEDDE